MFYNVDLKVPLSDVESFDMVNLISSEVKWDHHSFLNQ